MRLQAESCNCANQSAEFIPSDPDTDTAFDFCFVCGRMRRNSKPMTQKEWQLALLEAILFRRPLPLMPLRSGWRETTAKATAVG
jgi:hypothetical protein